MALFNLHCPKCDHRFRKILSKLTPQLCPKCQTEVKWDQKGPTAKVVETLDNGYMAKKVERLQDADQLFKERSKAKID